MPKKSQKSRLPAIPGSCSQPTESFFRHSGQFLRHELAIKLINKGASSYQNLLCFLIPFERTNPSPKWCGGRAVGEATWPVARRAGRGAGAPPGVRPHQTWRGCLSGALPRAKRSEFPRHRPTGEHRSAVRTADHRPRSRPHGPPATPRPANPASPPQPTPQTRRQPPKPSPVSSWKPIFQKIHKQKAKLPPNNQAFSNPPRE